VSRPLSDYSAYDNTRELLDALWGPLAAFRHQCTSKAPGTPTEDDWDDLCSIMAWLAEDIDNAEKLRQMVERELAKHEAPQ